MALRSCRPCCSALNSTSQERAGGPQRATGVVRHVQLSVLRAAMISLACPSPLSIMSLEGGPLGTLGARPNHTSEALRIAESSLRGWFILFSPGAFRGCRGQPSEKAAGTAGVGELMLARRSGIGSGRNGARPTSGPLRSPVPGPHATRRAHPSPVLQEPKRGAGALRPGSLTEGPLRSQPPRTHSPPGQRVVGKGHLHGRPRCSTTLSADTPCSTT